MAERLETFADFWPFYVMEHSLPMTRHLHFIGTTLLLPCLIEAIRTSSGWFLLLGMAFAYGFAWTGHFFVEKNRPATFRHPLFSLIGDFKMYGMMWARRMDQEVERCRLARNSRTIS
jgi:hypothetical protein